MNKKASFAKVQRISLGVERRNDNFAYCYFYHSFQFRTGHMLFHRINSDQTLSWSLSGSKRWQPISHCTNSMSLSSTLLRSEVWLLTNERQPMHFTYICTTTLSNIHWNSETCFDRSQSLSYFIVKLVRLAVFYTNGTFPHFCAIWHFIRLALIHAFSFLFIKYNQYLPLALSEGLKTLFKKRFFMIFAIGRWTISYWFIL